MFDLDLQIERRNELLDSFKGNKIVGIHSAIEELINTHPEKPEGAKFEQFKLVQHFNALMGIMTLNSHFEYAYVNNMEMRRGFLTNGGVFKVNKNGSDITIEDCYSMTEIDKLSSERFFKLKETVSPDNGWYFWPGCGMKIPSNFKIVLDPDVSKTRLVAILDEDPSQQIIIDEKNDIVGFSVIGDHELYNAKSKIPKGLSSINPNDFEIVDGFHELNLLLNKNAGNYTCSLHVPYASPKFDVRTTTVIEDREKGDNTLIASTT